VGQPIRAATLQDLAGRDRRLMIDAIGLAIAALLPETFRGVYADAAPGLEAARRVLREAVE
jgi:hypothetical protein